MVIVADPLRARLASATSGAPELLAAAGQLQQLGLAHIVHPRAPLEEEREPLAALFVVRRGWAFASKLLPNGSRQVIDFLLPGDLVGCAAALLGASTHSVETITETVVTEIPLEQLRRDARRTPALADLLLVVLALERQSLTERLVDLGRRDSVGRVIQLLLNLWRRLLVVGGATSSGYACPLSQYLIADATGLTAIHVNCVLRELREMGLLTFRHGYVRFHNLDRLIQLAGIDAPTLGRPTRRAAFEKGAA